MNNEADLILYIGMIIPLLGWIFGFLIMQLVARLRYKKRQIKCRLK
ncbi:MAG: hypothetical protein WC428_05475 [Candidatus Paceibacterota bacterium]|jgi:hypothetical protein